MADIFVSYKHEEREKIQGLVKALEGLQLDVWVDYDLAAGDAFGREINAQLGSAKAAIVCWSKGAVESDWVHAEADKARSLGTYASIMLEDCELPVPFNALHAADLSTWSGALARACKLARADVIKRAHPAWKHPDPRPRRAPPGAQLAKQVGRQFGEAILLAFAILDADQHANAVDVGDLEHVRRRASRRHKRR